MPRPPVLERPRVVPIVFEEKLYLELRRIADSRGVSVSSLIREIVLKYLGSISTVEADDPPAPGNTIDPPPGVDPVVQMDIEELAEEVSEIEKTVLSVESALGKYSSLPRSQLDFWFKHNRDKLLDRLVKAENALRKLRYKYYRLKRSAKNNGEVEALANRMYALKNKIKQLEGRLK
jgi:polyhydroxyalkanoate synthesis regulator phasin